VSVKQRLYTLQGGGLTLARSSTVVCLVSYGANDPLYPCRYSARDKWP